MNDTPNNAKQLPSWFVDNERTPTPTPPAQHVPKRNKLPFIIIGIGLLIVGGVIWYILATQAAKVDAFQRFYDTYAQFQSNLISFEETTEPDDLAAIDLSGSWKSYIAALDTLASSPIYNDNAELIKEIRMASLTYEPYVTQGLPALTRFLGECYAPWDDSIFSDTCQGYIKTVIDSNDSSTSTDARALQEILTQAARKGTFSQMERDSVSELQERIFALAGMMHTAIGPKVIELGKNVGVDLTATDS